MTLVESLVGLVGLVVDERRVVVDDGDALQVRPEVALLPQPSAEDLPVCHVGRHHDREEEGQRQDRLPRFNDA